MTTPHKHAEVLRAIADGKEVQFLNINDVWVDYDEDVHHSPLSRYKNTLGWRIKPEPKPDVVYYACFDEKDVLETTDHGELDSCITKYHDKKLDSLKITFDGETGELKLAEVISRKH